MLDLENLRAYLVGHIQEYGRLKSEFLHGLPRNLKQDRGVHRETMCLFDPNTCRGSRGVEVVREYLNRFL